MSFREISIVNLTTFPRVTKIEAYTVGFSILQIGGVGVKIIFFKKLIKNVEKNVRL